MSSRFYYLKSADELRNNPGQWAAYESKGNSIVIAGPGSGKTKVLTTKLARILAEDVREPRSVACITYSNECARELERRLSILGIEQNRRVFIGTVHSFALVHIIIPYAKTAQLGLPEDFKVARESDTKLALERAFHKTLKRSDDPQYYMFPMNEYRCSILDRSSSMWANTNQYLASLSTAYESELRSMGLIDFTDMPLLALSALKKNDWLQKAIVAKFPTLIIDEYQDLGLALHNMVMTLLSSGIRIFAVGDIDQSIYGFQGAQPAMIDELMSTNSVETHRLRLNYRSGASIVAASTIALEEHRDYESAANEESLIFFHPHQGDYKEQAQWLFSSVLPSILSRLPWINWSDIALLYPGAWIGNSLATEAAKHGISIVRNDKNAIYPRSSRLLRWIEHCAEWCCGGWKTGSPRFSQLARQGITFFIEKLPDKQTVLFQQKLVSFLWSSRDSAVSLASWLENFHRDIFSELLATCSFIHNESENFQNFFEKCKSGELKEMSLEQFAGQGSNQDSLVLTTLHSSKGREFSVVILFGMDEGRIPRPKPVEKEIIESRRLFYVGFTRAKKEVHIMYTEKNPSRYVTTVKKWIDSSER
ncbi:UvrD-helicase domain-containing protein [Desulfovibrio desulfuricans]|uniref:UvrD-helicase domain-containing protein n=1 Tax=Desulfovibrio desulfuricans TaxID=876 RepID=UPI0009DBB7F6|nr:ATP-dependent helicase [Desulfovibrio desulfuricans]